MFGDGDEEFGDVALGHREKPWREDGDGVGARFLGVFGKGDDGAVGDVADVGDGGELAAEEALEDLFALIEREVREFGGAAKGHEAVQAGGDEEVDVALEVFPEDFAVGIDGRPVGAENSF